MGRVLILGGTRNLGHVSAISLLKAGHEVTVLNRGITPDELPRDVERLHAERADHSKIRALVQARSWDAVVDTTSYTGTDAAAICELFRERCGRIVFVSTGQVYLVRTDARPPFSESDYEGAIIPEPGIEAPDHNDWVYGVEKRAAEEVFSHQAAAGVPVVSLRLPMIASERDHYGRIQAYIVRMQDGGPILIPDDSSLPIRHVYVEDVANVITAMCTESVTGYSSFNISYGESMSLADFFDLLGSTLGLRANAFPIERALLESARLLPSCSPYSGKWMSELDNELSVKTLPASFRYTKPSVYVSRIAEDYERRWKEGPLSIPGYDRRPEELELAKRGGKRPLNFLD